MLDELLDLRPETVLLLDELHNSERAEAFSQSLIDDTGWLLLPEEDEDKESSTLKDERSAGNPLTRCLDTLDRSVDVADKVNDIKDDSVDSCHGGVCWGLRRPSAIRRKRWLYA